MATVFQSTLPRGERPCTSQRIASPAMFQSTLPRGERPSLPSAAAAATMFQSTLPRGERRFSVRSLRLLETFQSTLPRGERLRQRCRHPRCQDGFNPRSRAGSDSCVTRSVAVLHKCFNPRSRAGSDALARACACASSCAVSIHAPARGATTADAASWQTGRVSIHAPARGATPSDMPSSTLISEFQSTLPRGERLGEPSR